MKSDRTYEDTGINKRKQVICLIAEGSYPYITGGVSSWIQMLIEGLAEYNFILYAISADDSKKGKFVYKIPNNVIEIREVFLNTFLVEKANWGRRYNLKKAEIELLVTLLTSRGADMDMLFRLISKVDHIADFILSKSFFDILKKAYSEKYAQVSFLDYFWSVRSMVMTLFNLLKQPMPEADYYHSVSAGYAGVIGAVCKGHFNKPFLMTEHGIYTREREEEIIKSSWIKGYFKDMWIDLFYSLSRSAYKSADKVVTLFSRNKEIEIEIGCPADKIQIIPNGIKIEAYSGLLGKGHNTNRINIGAIVRVVPIKDIKTMLYAFSLVKQEVANADFYIMGPTDEDTVYYEECTRLVELLELKDVYFTGRVDVKDYIGKMDALVLTSISEGQPLVILEGMACKKPFVVTDVGSCSELLYGIDDFFGDAGFIAPVMDYVKIAQGIIKFCTDDKLRRDMGQNGYERVSQIYTYDQFIGQYKQLYKQLDKTKIV